MREARIQPGLKPRSSTSLKEAFINLRCQGEETKTLLLFSLLSQTTPQPLASLLRFVHVTRQDVSWRI